MLVFKLSFPDIPPGSSARFTDNIVQIIDSDRDNPKCWLSVKNYPADLAVRIFNKAGIEMSLRSCWVSHNKLTWLKIVRVVYWRLDDTEI